jgi:lipocalin
MRSALNFLALSFFITALHMSFAPMNAFGSDTDDERPVTTVHEVNLERYVGVWYEIAKIPNRFQKQCVRGTTAEYTLREDGRISVGRTGEYPLLTSVSRRMVAWTTRMVSRKSSIPKATRN